MGSVTTVIFDVFGTLFPNRIDQWVGTFGEICQIQQLPVEPKVLWHEWKSLEVNFRQERINLKYPEKSLPFKSYREAWRDCFLTTFNKLELIGDPEEAAAKAVEDMAKREPFEDTIESITDIQKKWNTGALSNADDAFLLPLIEKYRFKFQGVLSSEGAHAYKPLPEAFNQVLKKMGVGCHESVYVGDNPFDDILGAKLAGMKAVWINRKGVNYDTTLPQFDAEIGSLSELSYTLERL